jgi:aminoglycoside phosphotransferase (APT) family kinase protein
MNDILSKIKNDEIEYEIAKEGIANITYITENRIVQEPEDDRKDKLRRNSYICSKLSENEAPVPEVIEVNENPFFVVYERLRGIPLEREDQFTEEEYLDAMKNTGKSLAEIHKTDIDISRYGKPDQENNFQKANHLNWQEFVDDFIDNTLNYVESDRFSPIAERASELINTDLLPKRPESKIMHLDYTPDNIIIGPNLNAKVIDFDDAYYGDPRFDLMLAKFTMSKRGKEARSAFTEGYESERKVEISDEIADTYKALSVIQNTKAGEWCSKNDKDVNLEEWSEGLKSFLDSIENQ